MDQIEILLEHLWNDFNSKVTKIHTQRSRQAEESRNSCRGTTACTNISGPSQLEYVTNL